MQTDFSEETLTFELDLEILVKNIPMITITSELEFKCRLMKKCFEQNKNSCNHHK